MSAPTLTQPASRRRGLDRSFPRRLIGLLLLLAAMIPAAAADRPAPDYSARTLGRRDQVSLASLRGRVVLVNTWATWCAPCRQEMPAFEALYRRYREQGLQVIAVNIDEGEADSEVERYVTAVGVSFPIWRDPENRFAKHFRVLGVPETFLIDRAGKIRRQWRGPMDPEAAENLRSIRAALGKPAEAGGSPVPAAGNSAEVRRGRRLAEQRGCLGCHSTDGAQSTGPGWMNLAGTEARLADGRSLRRDRDYLIRAILDPDAEVVAGYSKGLMAGAMPGRKLSQTEGAALASYIQSLGSVPKN